MAAPRARLRLASAAALVLACAAAPASAKDDPYAADCAHLLEELPRQAKVLLAAKEIDWAKATRDLKAQAKSLDSDAAFVDWTVRLLARLKDGHAFISSLAPELEAAAKASREAQAQGRRWTGPRVHVAIAGKKVLVVEASGPAAEQGVTLGMEVLEIDGTPALAWLEKRADELCEREGFSTRRAALHAAGHWGLAGWEGAPIAFTLHDGRDRKQVRIVRQGGPNFAPAGPVIPPAGLAQVGRQSYGKTLAGLGYVHLRDAPEDLPAQLDQALEALGDVPGVILDLRANGGGYDDGVAVGRFVAAGARWRQYTGEGKRPFAGPLVVIVDAGVRSSGETIAGSFKEDGRAYLIGPEPTAGMSSQKVEVQVPSKRLTVRVSVASNKGRFNAGKGIEGLGVAPHQIVPYSAADLRAGIDTQIARAQDLLVAGFPKGVVPYVPPK
jgi:C-terminal processing protease CtpA/Prc